MSILIIDDSAVQRKVLQRLVEREGLGETLLAENAWVALEILDKPDCATSVDLILLDFLMPGLNGIETCRMIKERESLQDVPVIMVTSVGDLDNLAAAFEAGVMDYILKPVQAVDLLARSRSALRLKHEIDKRKKRERQLREMSEKLREANRQLEELSHMDDLTGIFNRRQFEKTYENEWRRASRSGMPLSVIMMDIDFFKKLNDRYGHPYGDWCLKQVAGELTRNLRRPADLVARYGGEEFVAVLSETDGEGAAKVAEAIRSGVEGLGIRHEDGLKPGEIMTLSLGLATARPEPDSDRAELLQRADQALYEAKAQGRNRVCRDDGR